MSGATNGRPGDAGFTLVEVVVALALFALIATAGAALLSTILDADRHTASRLDRLADRERALAVVTRDLTEIADAPLVGTAGGVAFDRHRAGSGGATVAYRLTGGHLERVAGGSAALVLDHVAAARWRYYARPGGWRDHWPGDVAEALAWPAAVAVDLDLSGPPPAGHLRRVVDLPVRPLPPGAAGIVAAAGSVAPAPGPVAR